MKSSVFLSLTIPVLFTLFLSTARQPLSMSTLVGTDIYGQHEDTATANNLAAEFFALQRLMDSIDAGPEAVRNYFRYSDYSILYDYLDEPQHLANKKALQDGSHTVVYIPLDAYQADMNTNHYYTYEGPADSLKIIYDENGMVTDVVGFTYRGVYKIRALTE